MNDQDFDRALIAGVFDLAAAEGWSAVSVGAAARWAGLPLDRARLRFPLRSVILVRLGRMADVAALSQPVAELQTRERLFDILMRRFDAMQPYRAGIGTMLRALPADPLHAGLLYATTLRSMAWMLEGAGISSAGAMGTLRSHGLLAVWMAVTRTFVDDESEDLSSTMAAMDRALDKAEQAAGWLASRTGMSTPEMDSDVTTYPETAAELADAIPPLTPPPMPEPPASPPM